MYKQTLDIEGGITTPGVCNLVRIVSVPVPVMANLCGRNSLCCNRCLKNMVVSCILLHEWVNILLRLWRRVTALSRMEVLLTHLFDRVALFGMYSKYLSNTRNVSCYATCFMITAITLSM